MSVFMFLEVTFNVREICKMYIVPDIYKRTCVNVIHAQKHEQCTVVSHIYAYDRAKTLSFILLIRRKSTEFENESND